MQIIPGVGEAMISALEKAFFACVLIDDDSRIRLFNLAAEKLWGCSRHEVIGEPVEHLVPQELRAGHGDFIKRNREGGDPVVVGKSRRLQLRRKNGEAVWASFTLLRLDIGRRICYLALVSDVTEEVNLAQRLQLQFSAFNSANQPMAILNADRRLTEVNAAFASLFGYEPRDMVGEEPAALLSAASMTPSEFARHQALPWGREPVLHEAKAHTKDGSEIWVRIFSSPLENTDSPYHGFSLDVVHNITESRRLRELEQDVLQSLASSLPYAEQGRFLCRRVREIASDIFVSIMRIDNNGRLRLWAADGLPDDYLQAIEGLEVGPTVGSCGSAAWLERPVICRDIEHDALWKDYAHLALGHGLKACWSFPIKLRSGVVAGTFAFYTSSPAEPTAYHLDIVESCTHLAVLAIEQEMDRVRLDRLTHFDGLTGLPNQDRMRRHIDELLLNDSTASLSLLVLGLDGFREINDGLGYAVGDQVLLEVASRLQACLEHLGLVSRMGGDVFVMVVPNHSADATLQLSKRLQAVLGEPFDARGHQFQLTVSVGMSLYPQDGDDQAGLLEGAHKAMHEAKAAGKGGQFFFSPEMNARARERFLLGIALRRAILEGGLRLVYQPQVCLSDRSLYGVEALARWSDPERGEVSPEIFIKLAEEIGEIESLGRWALRQACYQMEKWRAEAVSVPVVSVNLSPASFRDPELTGYVGSLLREYSLKGECLTVEITETESMELTDDMLEVVCALRALGVGLSVDDFGTGFSSLSNLVHLPITEVKIDRSFIKQCQQDARLMSVVAAVIGMGHSLQLNVVAEGVETAEQCNLLQRLNPVVQGYFFSCPLNPEMISSWLTHHAGGQPSIHFPDCKGGQENG